MSSKDNNGNEYSDTRGNDWEVKGDNSIVTLKNTNTNTVSVTGNQVGTVVLEHEFKYKKSNGSWKSITEDITITVYKGTSSDQADANSIIAYVVTSSDDTTYGLNGLKIRYEDTDGNDISLGSGAISQFTFGNKINVNKSTFAQPAGVIDGYVFEDAYFYWSGHYSGTKYYATEFYNFGEKVTHYVSYIGFKCSNTSQATDRDGYFAYDPTGVLHLVYKQVSQDNPYKIYYMNGDQQYDVVSATSSWSSSDGKYVYKFKATEKADPTYLDPEDGHTYEFKGWNTKSDGTGDWAEDIYSDGKTIINSDVYLYAVYEDTKDESLWHKIEYKKGTTDTVTGMPDDVDQVLEGTEQSVSTDEPTRYGYIFAGWETEDVTVGTDGSFTMPNTNVVFTAQWEEDKIGTDPEDPNKPDGVPDKYQKMVIYRVENGSWNDGTDKTVVQVVTLIKDDEPSLDGTAEITAPEVGNRPNPGYTAGSWDKEIPASIDKNATELEFTYTYNPPVTPGGNPAGPVSPDTVIRAVTGAPPAVAAVLGGALDNAAAAVRELITDEDEDVPLANMKGEHKCCIFHFLLMLIALIILALYTRSMKKRQEEIFELREKIDEERARRGLPPIQKK